MTRLKRMQSLPSLITGVTGQDGAYLAKNLLAKGDRVLGVARPGVPNDYWRLAKLGVLGHPSFELIDLDITQVFEINNAIRELRPKAVVNFASHSYVVDQPGDEARTLLETGQAVINMLDAIAKLNPETKFFQASSSEMFGASQTSPQNEETTFNPRNTYGKAKVLAHRGVQRYRTQHGLFCSSGILYNHESPLRGLEFVTRKVTNTVAKISLGLSEELRIGNLSSQRDWGYAPEYVDAIMRILSHETPDDFIVATGTLTSVREFVTLAFGAAGISLVFEGDGLLEAGYDHKSGRRLVSVDSDFYRDSEDIPLSGNPAKIELTLGWKAQTAVHQIISEMVERDLDLVKGM
jgi:GDPmannose 4,6-dehydratase